MLEDTDGNPLNIGRKSRSIAPALRRALKHRDAGCRFPGCTVTRFVDGHHIRNWSAGGETSLDNLVLLCRRHHRLVHEGGFGLHRMPDGELRFTTPAGAEIPDVIVAPSTAGQPSLPPAASDGRPGWNGDRMDWSMALELLLTKTRTSEIRGCRPAALARQEKGRSRDPEALPGGP